MAKAKKMTKKDRALLLFEQNNNKSRKELIDLFVRELDTTEGSARTHLSWCMKELKDKYQLKYETRKIDKSGLKREKAMTIFKQNPQLSRDEMIEKFEKDLEMTRNSAATHCSMCSKAYKGPKHNAVV